MKDERQEWLATHRLFSSVIRVIRAIRGFRRHSPSHSLLIRVIPESFRGPKVRLRRCRSGQSVVSSFGHLPAQVGEQIAPGDQPQKLVSLHDNGDAAPIEYPEQIINFRGRRDRFQLIGHRLLHLIIKM